MSHWDYTVYSIMINQKAWDEYSKNMTYFEKHVKESILVDEKVTIGSILGLVDKLVDRFEYNPNVEVENLKIYFENDDDFKRKKSEYPSGTWKLCINLQVRGKPRAIYVCGEKDGLLIVIEDD